VSPDCLLSSGHRVHGLSYALHIWNPLQSSIVPKSSEPREIYPVRPHWWLPVPQCSTKVTDVVTEILSFMRYNVPNLTQRSDVLRTCPTYRAGITQKPWSAIPNRNFVTKLSRRLVIGHSFARHTRRPSNLMRTTSGTSLLVVPSHLSCHAAAVGIETLRHDSKRTGQ